MIPVLLALSHQRVLVLPTKKVQVQDIEQLFFSLPLFFILSFFPSPSYLFPSFSVSFFAGGRRSWGSEVFTYKYLKNLDWVKARVRSIYFVVVPRLWARTIYWIESRAAAPTISTDERRIFSPIVLFNCWKKSFLPRPVFLFASRHYFSIFSTLFNNRAIA